jgi:ribose-phosphate pyrophosphokinase
VSAILFALPGNENLAGRLSQLPDCSLGEWRMRRFPDGETYLRFLSPVRSRTAVLVCTFDQPDEKLPRVYLAARTLRDLGAQRVLLVAPYLPYMRQDTVFAPGEGISARHVAQLLCGCVDGLVTVDPHLHRVHRLEQIYPVPLRVVSAARAIAEWIRSNVTRPLLVGPDQESEQWLAAIAERLDCPWRVLRKQRFGDRAVSVDPGALEDLAGFDPVLVDDIVSSGTTVIKALEALADQHLAVRTCIVVHGLFAGTALDDIRRAGATRVLACNTVPHAADLIDIAQDIGAAVADLLASH